MMSRKNYKAIAKVVNREYHNTEDMGCRHGMKELILNLMDVFAEDNPRFDNIKFENACFGE